MVLQIFGSHSILVTELEASALINAYIFFKLFHSLKEESKNTNFG